MSKIDFLLLLACLPAIVICNYVYKKDINKEPKKLLKRLFFGGILSVVLVIIISNGIGAIYPSFSKEPTDLIQLIPYIFLGVALVEEFSKWIVLYFMGYKSVEYDEIYDMVVYAVFLGLGFATFENILYVFSSSNSVLTGVVRAILSVPGHACFAVFMGCFMTLAKISSLNGKKGDSVKYMIFSIVIPTLAHGIYDYCLYSGLVVFLLVFGVFIITMYIICIKEIKKFSRNNYLIKKKYCTKCSHEIVGNFCSFCGQKVN